MPIALIIHGGAWAIPDSRVEANLIGCRAALDIGWAMLEAGGTALDACEAAVRALEDNPTFNAGTGSVLNADGEVEMDAALMDGSTLAYGAVSNIRHIRNPITLARHVLLGPATMLAGAGAERFAVTHGMSLCANPELIVERERKLWQRLRARQARQSDGMARAVGAPVNNNQHVAPRSSLSGRDTVGAIALDRKGCLVAANSTGGTPFKLPGRVGDTPLIGCGLYADTSIGACVATGWGESITRLALARHAVELLDRGRSPHSAAREAVALLSRRVAGGNGGCILLSPRGLLGVAWNTPRMAYAYRIEGGQPVCGV